MIAPYVKAVGLSKRYQKGKQQVTPLVEIEMQIAEGEFIALSLIHI